MDLSAIDQVTPTWLTQIFKKSSLLQNGKIISIQKTPLEDTPFSIPKITRLHLIYSDDATGNPPETIIFKIAKREKEWFFYKELAKSMQAPPIPRCFYTDNNQETETSYLLLEDLGTTHTQTRWPIAPSFSVCEKAMHCIAEFHAFWWQHPNLENDLKDKLTLGDYWINRINLAIKNLPSFFDFMGDRISTQRKGIYETVLSSSNIFWQPQKSKCALTLIHGDAHFWNFLYPHEETDHVCAFDWNGWDIGKGTDDLAYMIGLHWYPERRKRFEEPLLRSYHETLLEHGVENYAWEDCWDDYRHSAIMNLFIPVWQWAKGISQIVWWSHLERSFLTFEDLNCKELL